LLEAGELIVQHLLAVKQQPPDQRGLPIIDTAAGQEAEQRLVRLLRQPEIEIGVGAYHGEGHVQKYPSCFFFSMEPAESLSISLPSRSDVRLACISMIMEGRSAAVDRMAPVSG